MEFNDFINNEIDKYKEVSNILKNLKDEKSINDRGEQLNLGKYSNVIMSSSDLENFLGFNPLTEKPNNMTNEEYDDLLKLYTSVKKIDSEIIDKLTGE
jgi:hypothetical protein